MDDRQIGKTIANELREVEVFEMGGMFAFLIEPIECGDVFE